MHKDIKNIHLSVNPLQSAVQISAPLRMELARIRIFAISKFTWIKQQQAKLSNQLREAPREYLDQESHYLWGDRYLLNIVEKDAVPQIHLKHRTMNLEIRPGTDRFKKHEALDEIYRRELKAAIPPMIEKWEKLMGVNVTGFTIRKMKTKWGSCSSTAQTIRLNLELAKKPTEYLEYVIVHEIVHLLEPTHNKRFIDLMDQFIPQWRSYREALNRLPLATKPGELKSAIVPRKLTSWSKIEAWFYQIR